MIINPKNQSLKELSLEEKTELFNSFYKTAYLIINQQEPAIEVTWQVFRQENKRKKQDKRKYDKPDTPKNPTLTITDIIDAQSFAQKLVKDNDLLTKRISKKIFKKYLGNNFQEVLNNSYKSHEVLKNLKEQLKKGLNECISEEDLLIDLRAILSPRLGTMLDSIMQLNKIYQEGKFIVELEEKKKASKSKEAINRLILERCYQGQIVTSTQRQAVNHTLEQSLQIDIMTFSDQIIKSYEEASKVTELDMIISLIVNLLVEVYSNNPFFAAVAFAGLIFEYERKDIQEIYSLVVQNRNTQKDPEQFSGLKRRLMNSLINEDKIEEGRFGKYHTLSIEATPNSLGFKTRANCQEIASEIRLILETLAFRSDRSCINFMKEAKKDQGKWIITPFVFQGIDPDEEHPFFQRQIHTISHPLDFEEIINMLNLPNPFLRLAIPEIKPITQPYKNSSNNDNNNDYFNSPLDKQNDRFNPPPLDKEIVKKFFEKTLEDEENLAKKMLSQKGHGIILLKINNKTCARFKIDSPPKDDISIIDKPSLLSVFWEYSDSSFGDIVLQSSFIRADFDEKSKEIITCDLGKGRRLIFTIKHEPGQKQFHIHIDYELASLFSWLNKRLQTRSDQGKNNLIPVLAGAVVTLLVIAVVVNTINNPYEIIQNNPSPTPVPTLINRSSNENQKTRLYVTVIGDDPLKVENLLINELSSQKVTITNDRQTSNYRLNIFTINNEVTVSVESVGDPLGEELKWVNKYNNINKNNQMTEVRNMANDIIKAINDYKLEKTK